MIFLSLFLIFLSVALLAGAVVRFLLDRRSHLTRRLVRATASLILAILAIEAAYACQNDRFALPATLFTDIMQAFSLDADYGAVASRSWSAFSTGWFQRFLTFYSVLLYSLAPIAGGAVIYDILAGVSPSIKLAFCKRRQLFVFSELNERAILLAESIAAHKQSRRDHAFVFTDAYVGGSEEDNELLMRAKALGAVCLQDDILDCPSFRASRDCYFFLMDLDGSRFNDLGNVSELHKLLDVSAERPPMWKTSQGCRIIFFSNSAEAIENVRSIKKAFDAANSADKNAPYGTVTVSVIRDWALTASLLLRDKPLFQTLGAPQPGVMRPLRTVIFGGGDFAHELFKAIFSLGQMLDVQLYITVVSDPGARPADRPAFQAYLDRMCPELTASCGCDGPDCLRIWPRSDSAAPPYAILSFIEADVRGQSLREFLDRDDRVCAFGSQERYRLADGDYFFITGEDDTRNAELAGELSNSLIYLRAKSGRGGRPAQIIAPMVQNDDLSRIVRARFLDGAQVQRRIHGAPPPEIYPFGSLKARYSYEQVFFSEKVLAGQEPEESRAEHAFADISASGDDLYNTWSGAGRDFHLPYKMYCAGCTGGGRVEDALRYRRTLESDRELFTRLTWLEHRRWNAFIRVQGFTRPAFPMAALEDAFGPVMPALLRARTNEQARAVLETVTIPASLAAPGGKGGLSRLCGFKDVPSKLQPCLVEADPAVLQDPDRYDLLDLITAARLYIDLVDSWDSEKWPQKKDKTRSDVKRYDRPWQKQMPNLAPREVLQWMQQTGQPGAEGRSLRTEQDVKNAWDALLSSDTPIGRELAAYRKTWEV